MDHKATRSSVAVVAVAVLCALVTTVVVAQVASGGRTANTSAGVKKQLKKLKKRIKRLERNQRKPRRPTGPAGGDLTGRYPNPSLAPGSLTPADFSGSIPAARVTRTANQFIPFNSNSATTIQFDAERFDTAGLHDAAAHTRLTAPIPGLYVVTAQVSWEPGPGSVRTLALTRNGGTTVARTTSPQPESGTFQQEVATVVRLAAGDYIEATVFHADGAGANILKQDEFSPEMSMTWVAPGP